MEDFFLLCGSCLMEKTCRGMVLMWMVDGWGEDIET